MRHSSIGDPIPTASAHFDNILTDGAVKKYEAPSLGEPLDVILLLRQFSHKVQSWRQALTSTTIFNIWRRVVWAASCEAARSSPESHTD